MGQRTYTSIERRRSAIRQKMNRIDRIRPDIEAAHEEADAMLCELLLTYGETEVVEFFKSLEKWYA